MKYQQGTLMASIIGKGVLKPFSQTLVFQEPVAVAFLPELIKLPADYRENVIVVRDGKVLSLDEMLHDDDELLLFIAVMGG
jgi:sulfur carrier protein ThiS